MPYSSVRLCSRAVTQVGLSADLFSTSSASSHVICQRVTLPPPQPIASAWLTCRVYSTVPWRAGAWCRPQHHCRPLALSLSALAHKHCSSLTQCDREQADPPPALEPQCSSDDAASVGGCDSGAEDPVFKTPISQLDIEKLYAALHCADDEDTRRKVDLILLEYNCLMLDNQLTPTFLRRKDWLALLQMHATENRNGFLEYLGRVELKNGSSDSDKHRSESQAIDGSREDGGETEDEQEHAGGHSVFLPLGQREINLWQSFRLWQAMVHGPRIVIDMGYDHILTFPQIEEIVAEVKQCIDMVAASMQPFDIHLSNVHTDTAQHEIMAELMPDVMAGTNNRLHVHSCSHVDLFDTERIVYLSPHSRRELVELDDDTIYIVGGLCNLCRRPMSKYSLERASKDDVRTACLPLKSYLRLGGGFNSSLSLPKVFEVLLSSASGSTWPEAFQSIPSTYLKPPHVLTSSERRAVEHGKIQRLIEERTWRKNNLR